LKEKRQLVYRKLQPGVDKDERKAWSRHVLVVEEDFAAQQPVDQDARQFIVCG
jgi:hypothetical protein